MTRASHEISNLMVLHDVLDDSKLDDRGPVVVQPEDVTVEVVELLFVHSNGRFELNLGIVFVFDSQR